MRKLNTVSRLLMAYFTLRNPNLAECYKRWKRCLAVTDLNIYSVYGKQMEKHFEHYGLELKIHKTKIGKMVKAISTLLNVVDSMNEFGIYRKSLCPSHLPFFHMKL